MATIEQEPESAMVGITLSSEQIKSAPPDVRRWLEQEVLAAFDWHAPAVTPNEPHLVACTVEDAFKIFAAVRDMIPVANVFFTLGNQGANVGEGVVAFRATEVMRHAHLADPQQLVACLDVLNEAFRRVRADDTAVLCGLDDRGYCFVAQATRISIAHVWQETIALENLKLPATTPSAPLAPQSTPSNYTPYAAWPAHADAAGVTSAPAQAHEDGRVSEVR
jgi:hypothetical protein